MGFAAVVISAVTIIGFIVSSGSIAVILAALVAAPVSGIMVCQPCL
jgi:multisubunit Na+/H+ antiporter MnhG subunit